MVGREERHSCAGNISWRKVVRLQLHSTNFRVFHFVPFPVIDPLHALARPFSLLPPPPLPPPPPRCDLA